MVRLVVPPLEMGAFVTALTKELPSKLLVTMVVAAYVVSVVVPHFVTKSMEPCVRTLQLYRFPSLAVLAIDQHVTPEVVPFESPMVVLKVALALTCQVGLISA